MAIEFFAAKNVMERKVFDHLVDLAAETWMKAAQKWRNLNQLPLRFEPAAPLESRPGQVKRPGFSPAA